MQRVLRSAAIFVIVFASACIAPGKAKDSSPNILEYRDVPMQTLNFRARKTPNDCIGNFLGPDGQVCWRVYPIVWQSFNKQKKGMDLLINVLATDNSIEPSYAALTITIDGKLIDLPSRNWERGNYTFEGHTTVVKDEPLIRMIAAGTEVWVTAHSSPRISIRLSPKTLTSMQAIITKYDSLEPAETSVSGVPSETDAELTQLDAKIRPLTAEYQSLQEKLDSVQKQCPGANETCLEKGRDILVAGQKVDESVIALLNERMSLLNAMTQGAHTEKEKSDTAQMLGRIQADETSLRQLIVRFEEMLGEKRTKTQP